MPSCLDPEFEGGLRKVTDQASRLGEEVTGGGVVRAFTTAGMDQSRVKVAAGKE